MDGRYVDDPRNTDNSWIETTAMHFHCTHELGKSLELGGSKANAKWVTIDDGKHALRNLSMYANHRDWVKLVVKRIEAREQSATCSLNSHVISPMAGG